MIEIDSPPKSCLLTNMINNNDNNNNNNNNDNDNSNNNNNNEISHAFKKLVQ